MPILGVSDSAKIGRLLAALAGYFAGGNDSGGNSSSIYKLVFSTDTRVSFTPTLTTARRECASASNNGTAGYVSFGSGLNSIDKLTFLTETVSSISATAPTNRNQLQGASNSGTAGYFGGGYNGATTTYFDAILKLSYSGETLSTLGATLSSQGQNIGACANSGTAAYFSGGEPVFGAGPSSAIDKLLFSNETRSTLGATLSTGKARAQSISNGKIAMYYAGGLTSANYINVVDKLAYSNDTRSTISATLTGIRARYGGASNSGTAGYFAGGYDGNLLSSIDKLLFSGETISSIPATLATAVFDNTGFANCASVL